MLNTAKLLDLEHTIAADYLSKFEYPWEALAGISDEIINIGNSLDKNAYNEISPNVWVHQSAVIAPTAYLGAPCIIGKNTEVRHCAFIRGSALVGENCVVGNSVELKNVILFDNVQTPHYNYVGDSILGYKAHMGAGSITSNIKQDRSPVTIKTGGERVKTNLIKFGAIIGDNVEIGCNAVLNPGTIIGRNARIYPLTSVRGYILENRIFKGGTVMVNIR